MDETTLADFQAAIARAAEGYRQQIVAARCSTSSEDYAKNNGRAEATRQVTTDMARVVSLPCPDWDAIRRAVPADGIYRAVSR